MRTPSTLALRGALRLTFVCLLVAPPLRAEESVPADVAEPLTVVASEAPLDAPSETDLITRPETTDTVAALPDAAPARAGSVTDRDADPAAGAPAGVDSVATTDADPASDADQSMTPPAVADDLDYIERQIDAGEAMAARSFLEARVQRIAAATHHFDAELIRPLILLGDACTQLGDHAAALGHYQHATHLLRVNNGLHAMDQIDLVYREATTYRALGQFNEAGDREDYAFQLLDRNVASNDPALLSGLRRLASWHLETGNPFAARALYERAVTIHQTNGSLATTAAVDDLRALAETYRLERFPATWTGREQATASIEAGFTLESSNSFNQFPAGELALQQVVRIRQETAAEAPLELVEAVLELADWYTLFDKKTRANPLYAHAFELLGDIPDIDRNAWFATPKPLYFPDPGLPRSAMPAPDTEPATGYVDLGYEVTDDGYVRSLQTLASEPEGLMELRLRRSMRVARFRPALVDGVPVASANQQYHYPFAYHRPLPKPEPAATDDATPAEAASADAATQTGKEIARQ